MFYVGQTEQLRERLLEHLSSSEPDSCLIVDLERARGFEPLASCLGSRYSTTELRPRS